MLMCHAHDVFDVDAICEEFKRKYKVAADNEEQEVDEQEVDEDVDGDQVNQQ